MPRSSALALTASFVAVVFMLAGPLVVPLCAQGIEDGDMELADRGPWNIYGTPLSVEKSTFARGGVRSLKVVTDNKETMGGNYEGTSHSLGRFEAGDLLRVSFWYWVKGSQSIVVGIGPTSFMGRWVLSGTDWTRADLSFRCPKTGPYNIWISQGGSATEFYLDEFELETIKRPELGIAPEDQRIALTGGDLRVWLCRRTGALCGIENLAIPQVYAPVGRRQPLLGLEMLSQDGLGYDMVAFDSLRLADLSLQGDSEARLRFRAIDLPMEILVRVVLTQDGAARFTAQVHNDSQRTLTSVALPICYGVCPAADPKALTLVDPFLCGRITQSAIDSNGCRTRYPGRGVMGWMDLSGPRGGIYLATHDPSSTGTRLEALPAPGPAFDMSLAKEVVVKPGQIWQSPQAVLAVHEGDWHTSADRYRAWARSWMQPPDVPQWMHRAHGWVLMGVQNGIPFHRIPDIYRSAEWMGIDYLHVQGEGIDNMWFDEQGNRHSHALSYLYPSPRFGTPDELKDAVRQIHERKGHVMFYFLYERWTPSHSISDDFGTGRREDVPAEYQPPPLDFYYDNALVDAPGAEPPAEHPFMAHRNMCLGAPGWQEWMRHWAIDVYAKQYGADGFYWDVMGRNGPFRCFNARHGHEGQNEWAAGSAKVLKTVIDQGRKLNPDYSCSIEGCSDVLGQWVGFHLMSGATANPNVFRYTFPEYLLVDGFSNTTWKLTHPQKARRVFLDGERLDIHGYDQRIKKIINLRKRIKPFIDWPAVFEDTLGLEVSDPRVQARAFQRTDGDNRIIALTMMNEDHLQDATVTVDLTAVGDPQAVYVFGLDGTVQAFEGSDAGVQTINVPPDDVSAAVIVGQVAPELMVWGWVEQIMEPGRDGARLTILYPGGKPDGVDLKGSWPGGFPGPMNEVASQGPHLRRLEVLASNALRDVKRWTRIDYTLDWGGGQANMWTVVAPPVVNGDFEEVEDGRLVYWGGKPCEEDPAQGKYCIRIDREAFIHGHARLLTPVKPNCRYRFKCMLKRSEKATGGVGAHVVEYEEGSQFVRSAALNSKRPGDWETLETEFTTHADPRSTAIYLYNFDETEPAWFDGIELEEIR